MSERSRAERRRQERIARKAKRNEPDLGLRRLIVTGGGLLVVGLGGTAAVNYFLNQPQSSKTVKEQLADLDNRISRDSRSVVEVSSQVAALGIQQFAFLNGYAPAEFAERVVFQKQSEFLRDAKDFGGCTHEELSPNTAGFTTVESPNAHINTDYHLKNRNSATLMFASVIHELHHLKPPFKALDSPIEIFDIPTQKRVTATHVRGIVVYQKDSEHSMPGKKCWGGFFGSAEEAVVDDATIRIVNGLGIQIGSPYDPLREAYRTQVLASYFSGDHRPTS